MRLWPALILAPLAALAAIAVGYALVPAACAGREWILHLFLFVFLTGSLGTTWLAWADRKRHKDPFLPLVATGTGAFFSLVITAQWATRLFVDPCMA